MSAFLAKLMRGLRNAVYQSQEFTLWLPGMVLLAVLGFIVLGAFVPMGGDVLAWLAELPALCAYAAAALAMSWAIKKTYLYDLDAVQEKQLFEKALAGDPNARWLLVKDRLEWLACIAIAIAFFWPAR